MGKELERQMNTNKSFAKKASFAHLLRIVRFVTVQYIFTVAHNTKLFRVLRVYANGQVTTVAANTICKGIVIQWFVCFALSILFTNHERSAECTQETDNHKIDVKKKIRGTGN